MGAQSDSVPAAPLAGTAEHFVQVYLASQCHLGPLKPELYKSGALALEMGVEAGPQMTPECAVVKMMLCLAYPDISLGQPLAGEL